MPVACKFIEKETLLHVFKFCETLKDTFFNRTPHVQCLLLTRIAAFRPINNIIKYYSYCIILIRIDTILSKNLKDKFQNLLFKKLFTQLGDQTDIFWKFCLPADTLYLPKTVGQVLGYTAT